MSDPPSRESADFSAYPDLVVIYLGMRVEEPRGLETRGNVLLARDLRRGGFESMYVDVADPGLGRIAPGVRATGPMFSARQRRDAEVA